MRATILCALLIASPTARADTYWDVTKDEARKVMKRLKPGTILIRYCPGCHGAFSVIRVRSVRIAPGLHDPKQHQVVVERDLLLAGRSKRSDRLVIDAKARCGGRLMDWCSPHGRSCPDREEHVDLPYTFIEVVKDRWTGLYALATGAWPASEPPKLFLKTAELRHIGRCAARIKAMPPFTLGKRAPVWGEGTLASARGRVEVRHISHFKQPLPRGRTVTVVPFRPGLRPINLKVVGARVAKDPCTGEPHAELTLSPIRRKDCVAAATKNSAHGELCRAAVLHPARRIAAFVPQRLIKKRDLPRGIKPDHVQGAVDFTGNGRPDLLYVTAGEGSAAYLRTRAGWKRVWLSQPC
jgi:hypothetical protein